MSIEIPKRLDITKDNILTYCNKHTVFQYCTQMIHDTFVLDEQRVANCMYNEDKYKSNTAECGDIMLEVDNVIQISAWILNYCRDGELFFFGRSPENIYDFLSGVFKDFSWKDRLHLVLLSTRYTKYEETLYDVITDEQKTSVKKYLTSVGLHPKDIIQRKRRTCLVDFIHSGYSINNFVTIMERWCQEEKLSVKDMLFKFEFIMIEKEEHVVELAEKGVEPYFMMTDIVNKCGYQSNSYHLITISDKLWESFSENPEKVTESYPAYKWGDDDQINFINSHHDIVGIFKARLAYDYGCHKNGKKILRKHMLDCPSMKYKWFQQILSCLNGKPIKIHDNKHQVNMLNKKRRKKMKKGTSDKIVKYEPIDF